MIDFKKVTRDDFADVITMEVNDSQKGFMESNMYSLAECSFEDSFESRAIYNDGKAVGFMLYYFVKDDPDYVFLHRFMIDKKFQGQGMGRAGLTAAVDFFKHEYPSIGCVELMHYTDNEIGAGLYESLGFEKTGELRESEPCMCELGTEDINRTFEIVRRKYY